MEDSTEQTISPANEPTTLVPTVVVPPGEDEVVSMLVEESRFENEPEVQAAAARLLEAGYTVSVVARRLQLRPSTLWRWSKEPDIASAIQAGREYRRQTLGQGLEHAAEAALSALLEVAEDVGAAPRDRVKASEAILDRCGITPAAESAGSTTAVAVEVDFDDRLARIVAQSAIAPTK
tara:strand:- start:400 stop:933 length:534 start_codon:yes stop_codon:yes gene_type:complete